MNTEALTTADDMLEKEQLETLVNPIADALRNWCKLSDLEIDLIYNLGAAAYQKENWVDASKIFAALILLRPLNPVYLSAQGKCLKMLKDFDGAFQLFTLAQKLDVGATELSLHAAECLMLWGKKNEASEILKAVIEQSKLPDFDLSLGLKAEAWLNLLMLGKADGPS